MQGNEGQRGDGMGRGGKGSKATVHATDERKWGSRRNADPDGPLRNE